MDTELTYLHLFAKVAETLSFRETAKQFHVARSTVSKRIAQFERELGVSLFNRSTRRMSLTDAIGRADYNDLDLGAQGRHIKR